MHDSIEAFFYTLKVFLIKFPDSYLPEYAFVHNFSLKGYASDKWLQYIGHCKVLCRSKKAILRILITADQIQS